MHKSLYSFRATRIFIAVRFEFLTFRTNFIARSVPMQEKKAAPGFAAPLSSDLLTSTMFGLAVLGRTGFAKESLDGIIDTTLDSLRP